MRVYPFVPFIINPKKAQHHPITANPYQNNKIIRKNKHYTIML
jgi:hypothetical protein